MIEDGYDTTGKVSDRHQRLSLCSHVPVCPKHEGGRSLWPWFDLDEGRTNVVDGVSLVPFGVESTGRSASSVELKFLGQDVSTPSKSVMGEEDAGVAVMREPQTKQSNFKTTKTRRRN